ncbi:MAG: hypothetical protein WA488_14160, partial [Mycobacterium sp.]|uniref:hypothetical protein n=1 Tax=Mycobacterium sp. TaxID=1785 RepID=UPI003CC4C104
MTVTSTLGCLSSSLRDKPPLSDAKSRIFGATQSVTCPKAMSASRRWTPNIDVQVVIWLFPGQESGRGLWA